MERGKRNTDIGNNSKGTFSYYKEKSDEKVCPSCKGSGYDPLDGGQCDECAGTGTVSR